MVPSRPLEDRFWQKVDKTPSGCWLWTATVDRTGYGMIGASRSKKLLKAHRVSWELHNGPIPEGAHVCHSCDTPRCVNPEHLFLGSHLENMRDMYGKGRRPRPAGERNGRATLTWEHVREIRRSAAAGEPLLRLSKRLGVPRSTVVNIVHHHTWKDDPEAIAPVDAA